MGGSSHSVQSFSSHSVVMKPMSDDRQPGNRQLGNRQWVHRQTEQPANGERATGACERSFSEELPMINFTRRVICCCCNCCCCGCCCCCRCCCCCCCQGMSRSVFQFVELKSLHSKSSNLTVCAPNRRI